MLTEIVTKYSAVFSAKSEYFDELKQYYYFSMHKCLQGPSGDAKNLGFAFWVFISPSGPGKQFII